MHPRRAPRRRPIAPIRPPRRAVLGLVAAVLAGGTPAVQAQTDAELRQRLVGTWREARTIGCARQQHEVQLRDDGSFEANGLVDECGKVTLFVWRGTWEVREYRFAYVTTASNAPDRFPAGKRMEDEIVSVDAERWVMLEQASGQRSVAQRVR